MAADDRVVVFPGTYDPPTNGHLDVIKRGQRLFAKLIVAVGENPEKSPLFTADERVEMIRMLVRQWPNVEVESYRGLTVDYARKRKATAILRGIRSTVDLSHELRSAYTNRTVGGVETVFILTTEDHAMVSSTLIKQVAGMGGDVTRLVPPEIIERLYERLKTQPHQVTDPDPIPE